MKTETQTKKVRREINQLISDQAGLIAKLAKIQFVYALPKTCTGKIVRRILRKIAKGDSHRGTSTLINLEIIEEIIGEKYSTKNKRIFAPHF